MNFWLDFFVPAARNTNKSSQTCLIGSRKGSNCITQEIWCSHRGEVLTPEPGDVLLQSSVSHAAGVKVSPLKAKVWIGVILCLADVLLTHRLSVPRPWDVDRRRVEVGHGADESVFNTELHVALGVELCGRRDCGQISQRYEITLH